MLEQRKKVILCNYEYYQMELTKQNFNEIKIKEKSDDYKIMTMKYLKFDKIFIN